MSSRAEEAANTDRDPVVPSALDRSETMSIGRRFHNLNRARLARVHETLGPHQRIVLELLPLLFHTNHPLMPGYVDKDCPCGVSDYSPSKRTLIDAAKIARSFSMPKGALPRMEILGIYLMGSSGTIAQSSESDLDIWLCHRPGLAGAALDKLRFKAAAIERWGLGLGLELHIFVMCDERFRDDGAEALSSESSGTAQHRLLLDEFYRTGLLVAGRAPIWWLVPAEMESDYAAYIDTMVKRRFVKRDDYLDFGTVRDIDPAEFFGATLWQLTKAIDAPHKSLLKILLLEAYAIQYPRLDSLCSRFKGAVYAGEKNINRLDPYVLLYAKVEEHLAAHVDPERLELARRCLYFKANKSLPQLEKRVDWRCEALAELVAQWGWSKDKLRVLDARSSWKVDRVLEERKALVNALTRSYKLLSLFAREHATRLTVSERDMTVLGRKLFTAFEHKAGKIEIVSHGAPLDLSESHLLVQRVSPTEGLDYWLLYRDVRSLEEARSAPALKRGRTVMELVAWCHFNGLLTSNTRVILEGAGGELGSRDVEAIEDHLRKHFPTGACTKVALDDLARDARLSRAAAFVNFGPDRSPRHLQDGNIVTSNRSDALSFSGWHENLVQELDYLAITSWGEVLVQKHLGMEGLIACLCEHLKWLGAAAKGGAAPTVSICSSPRHGQTISTRLTSLFENVQRWFTSSDRGHRRRYVIKGGQDYHCLLDEDGAASHDFRGSFSELLQYLETPNARFSETTFDPHALDRELLSALFARNRPGVVQFFYLPTGSFAEVYILDENGALFTDSVSFYTEAALLNHYSLFFESVAFRRRTAAGGLGDPLPPGESRGADEEQGRVIFYKLSGAEDGYAAARIHSPRFPEAAAFFNVQVIAEHFGGETEFTIYCDGREFSIREHGARLFQIVADHILARRRSAEPYPFYITDLDLSWLSTHERSVRDLQMIHYLKYKKTIEHKLTRVLLERV